MRKLIVVLLISSILCTPALAVECLRDEDINIAASSAVLLEQETGTLLYEKDAHTHRPPASVTKVMTMLLVIEAIDSGALRYDTVVTASAHAASMGGSQIWLEEGERMTVDEMLKCVAVVSANDCAVALAEQIAGTEDSFVRRMNERAEELGMTDTHFTNCTGLFDSEQHYTSAYDIALMSRELMKHDDIRKYTTIWMDTARNGEFGLSNTNKLIYYYEGATGLKTGFTSAAMYCLAATAGRNGVEYIAVVMHAPTSTERFEDAKTLLNYGFANFELLSLRPNEALPPIPVELGTADAVSLSYDGAEAMLTNKGTAAQLDFSFELLDSVKAPVQKGQILGQMTVLREGESIAIIPLLADSDVDRLTFGQIFRLCLGSLFAS